MAQCAATVRPTQELSSMHYITRNGKLDKNRYQASIGPIKSYIDELRCLNGSNRSL